MSKSKVYRLPKRTSFRDLVLVEEPIPECSKYEVLIKVHSVSLNYRDLVIANSQYPFPVKDNVIPCSDVAGEVVEAGEATGFKKGDKVVSTFDISNLYGMQRDWEHGLGGPVEGVLRQYVSLPATSLVKLPESSLSFAQWACLPCAGVTAWNALYGNIPLKPGQTVLCQGTGGVSVIALMLAKAAGAVTIITSSSDDKLKRIQDLYQPDHCINYKTHPDWAEEALKVTNGRGVDYIIENGGLGTVEQSVKAITRGGIISVIGFLDAGADVEKPDMTMLVLGKGCVLRGINVGSTQMLEDLVRFVAQRKLQPPVGKTFGFSYDEVIDAYQYLSDAKHIGKVCINVT